jgi:hypothetical protein
MLRAIDPGYVWDFSLEPESVADRTVFKLGVVDSILMGAIEDGRVQYKVNNNGPDAPADTTINVKSRNIDVVRFGLKGWKNFQGNDGKDVVFRTEPILVPTVGVRQGLPDELVKAFDIEWIQKLGAEIRSAHRLSEQEKKT